MITDYSSLQSTIADYSHRGDLSAQIPIFIQLAESKLSNNIRSRLLEVETTLTTTGGVATLPDDYSSLKSIQILGGYNTILHQLSVNALLEFNATNISKTPNFFAIQGNTIIFAPIPVDGTLLDVVYYQQLVPLSGAAPTNWVLSRYPYIYLYGTMIELSVFIDDPEQIQFFQGKFDDAIADMWQNFANESFSGPLSANNDYIVDYIV